MSNTRSARLVLLLLVVVSVAFLALSHHGHKPARNYSRDISNLQDIWLHGNDLYFFSGSLFAKYNLQDGSVTKLSDYLFIKSGVSAVSWGTDSVVFQTSPQTADRDDVTTAASNLGANPLLPHWWVYNFSTKQYELLGVAGIDNCVSLVQVDEQSLACIYAPAESGSVTEVRLFNTVSRSVTRLQSSQDALSNLTSDGKSVFYTETTLSGKQNLEAINLSSKKKQDLYKSSGTISFLAAGGTVAIDEIPGANKPTSTQDPHDQSGPGKKTSHNLVILQNGAKTVKKISSSPITFFTDSKNNLFVSALDGSIKQVNGSNLRTINDATSKPLSQGDFLFSNGGRVFLLNQDGALLSSPGIKLPVGYKSPADFKTEASNDPSGNSYIDSDVNGSRDTAIYLEDTSSSAQQQLVGENLEKQGFRATEFKFNWIVDGPDFHVPISPNAVIIN